MKRTKQEKINNRLANHGFVKATERFAGEVSMGRTPEEIARRLENRHDLLTVMIDVDHDDLVEFIEESIREFEDEHDLVLLD